MGAISYQKIFASALNYPLGKDKTVADLLASFLPVLAGTAGVSGLLVAGVGRAGNAENGKRNTFDSIGFANTSLGIAVGLAGGGAGKALESKFGKGFGARRLSTKQSIRLVGAELLGEGWQVIMFYSAYDTSITRPGGER